jgi:hypothetical protein
VSLHSGIHCHTDRSPDFSLYSKTKMASNYHHRFNEHDPNKGRSCTETGTQYYPPRVNNDDETFPFQLGHSTKRSAPDEMTGAGAPRASTSADTGEGGSDFRGASYEELSKEISFLTSLVLETKHNQFSMNKRFKEEREFRHKGNKSQCTVLNDGLAAVDEADYAFEVGNFPNLKDSLFEIRKVLQERKKLVIMADTSEFGWDTVTAYLAMKQSLDEDETRGIQRAEAYVRAQRKTKAEDTAAKSKGRGAGRGRGKKGANSNQKVEAAQPVPGQANMQPFYANYPPQYNPYYQQQKLPVKCYRCYGYGHTSKTCPNPLPSYNYGQPQETPAAK